MSDERKPMANITPFGLRMQPDLKARIEAAAKKNERSMNAEIVARLQNSFELTPEQKARAEAFQEYVKEVIKDSVDFDEDRRTLYVALDANGLPISWPEIMKHLVEIGRAGDLDVQKIEGVIFDGTVESADDREEQILKLYKAYRKNRRALKRKPEE